ncbi:MAG: filamentous hemagglutinin N-terminal domain-containing protein [Desulfobulbaceae bacterium]|nr:filamentous hemagglutinin N-terminal domain-containing protein [Desulfobulbaceae bacterium]
MPTKPMNRRLCLSNFASLIASWLRLTGSNTPVKKTDSSRCAPSWLAPKSPYWRGLLAFSLFGPVTALAGPAGEQVTAGSATVSRPDAVTTVISQQSQKAVVDWQSFSTSQPEKVRFQQPAASSVTLNRVVGNDPSSIFGRLEANGQVFLVNPNGVLFGPDSQVSVHGLLATTHDINNDDFMAGRYLFARKEDLLTGAEVVNQGDLQAGENGYIVLAGDYAANSGVIQARLGQVALASGNHFTLDLDGDQLIGLAVDEASLAQRAGVENFGTLAADGGQVVMTAKVAAEVATTVVNNTGLIQAHSIEELNGEIILQGGSSGIVVNSGTLDASGKGAGETGGSVQVLGEKVGLLDQAVVDVSGAKGGGTALIGGDYQGKNPDVQNATATYVGQDAVIKAGAIDNGDGGRVIVWADEVTRAYGDISARGGETSGDGGFVEVSGKSYLDSRADIDTHAPQGEAGTLLLDPTDITITALGGAPTAGSFSLTGADQIFDGGANTASSMGWDYLNGLLSANNVIVQTNSAGAGTGSITFAAAGTSAGGTNSLSFLAEDTIYVNGSIQYTSSGKLIMVAGWDPASDYVTPTATHASNPGNMLINAPISSTGGGDIKLLAKGNLTQGANISITAAGTYNPAAPDGVISLISGGALTQTAGATLAGKAVYAEGLRVALTQNNPTGVIAGKATGAAATDTFAYTSANDVHLSTVNGFSGVLHTNASVATTYAVVLTGPSISQDAGAPVSTPTGKGLQLTTTGLISLSDSNNSVSLLNIIGTLSGPLEFKNIVDLSVGGVTTANQAVGIETVGTTTLTVPSTITAGSGTIKLGGNSVITSANISGSKVMLWTPEAGSISVNSGTISGSTGVELETDALTLTGIISSPSGEIGVSPVTDTRPITIGQGACQVGPCLLIADASTTKFDSLKLIIGRDSDGVVGDPGYPYPVSGDIYIGGTTALNRLATGWLVLLTGGQITQDPAAVITALNLGISAISGPVALDAGTNPHNVTNLAATTAGNFGIKVVGPLTVTSLTGGTPPVTITGVTSTGGNVTLITTAGDIILNAAVTAPGTMTLTPTGGVLVDNVTPPPPPPPPPPTVDQCTADPTLAGCTAVLPTLDACVTDPTAAGCSAVLPELDTCVIDPTAPGCSAVLPPLADCTTNPALPGCIAVLPTLDTCVNDPAAPGCSAVLPPLADCTTNPALPGCTAVLPTLDTCVNDPAAPGCSAVLPPLADCTTNPALPGCTTVLPPLATCITDPTLPGCTAIMPPALVETPPAAIVETIQAVVVADLVVPTQTAQIGIGIEPPAPASTPDAEQPPASSESNAAADNGDNEEKEESKAEEVALTTESQELPLAKQPIFDLSGGGIAGQNMVCK